MVALLAATTLCDVSTVQGFSPSHSLSLRTGTSSQQTRRLINAHSETKSSSSSSIFELNESRYGVRKRVRSVLERAKNRTGIRNSSDYLNQDDDDYDDNTKNGSKGFGIDINMDVNVDVNVDVAPIVREAVAPVAASAPTIVNGASNTTASTASTTSTSQPTPALTSEPTPPASRPIKTETSVKNIVADAASIGAFGDVDAINLTEDYKTALPTTKPRKKTAPASTAQEQSLNVFDALKGDVSAAFAMPPPPLPFTLPELTRDQQQLLNNGDRVQYQSDMGREGSGFVVMDVKAPAAVVWECLLDFYSYPDTIPTVRSIQMFTNTHLKQDYNKEKAVQREQYEDGTLATLKHGVPSVTRAAFTLSKFRLKIAAIHKYRPHPLGDYMVFTLDPACTNAVLKNAKGVWHTQSNPDGRGDEYTRVWLLCELGVSSLLPQWITDYAAKRAMPRATTWLKPNVEAAAELWFKGLKD